MREGFVGGWLVVEGVSAEEHEEEQEEEEEEAIPHGGMHSLLHVQR
jgi:hypothetical protein